MTPFENSVRLLTVARDNALEQLRQPQPRHVRYALMCHAESMRRQLETLHEFQRTYMARYLTN